MTSDSYKTIGATAQAEIKVQGSRFLSFAFPVQTREDALDHLHRLRREYHDATHHCSAWRLGIAGEQWKTSDDGEPAGSAGRPILQALERRELTDVLVVVVRYFGGTKLGVGGLVRAYGGAAEAALAAAPSEMRYRRTSVHVVFPHPLISRVLRTAGGAGGRVAGSWYDAEVHLALEVRLSGADALRDALIEATGGAIRFETTTPEDGSDDPAAPAAS